MIYKSYQLEKDINILKNNIDLFYGENIGLKNDIKKKLINKYKESEIIKYNQEEVIKDKEKFFKEVFNLSLFNDEKIFIIENANDKILPVINEIDLKIKNQKIFLFSDILEKKSKLRNYFEKSKHTGIIPCYADNEISIKKIILEKLKNFKGITPNILNIIIDNSNLDRSKLHNELDKIITFFESKTLDQEKLEKLLNMKINDDFKMLRDEALKGNKLLTNKLINDTVIEPDKNYLYLSLINQQLQKLLKILTSDNGKDLESTINKIKPPIFWKDRPILSAQALKWNIDKIKKLLSETYNIELKIKTSSSVNNKVLIKKLIVDICCLANS